MSAEEVDAYLAQLDEPRRATLEALRKSIAGVIPEAEEGLSYSAPCFRIDGRAIAGFSAAKQHVSYLPHSGEILGTLAPAELDGFTASKGALKIPIGSTLPEALLRKLIAARRTEAGV
jgi:uncharacterized protein YdhG (YjbR/CyaY superfamily)